MPCRNPITAWRAKTLNDSGKRGLTFSREHAYDDRELNIPCGKCKDCRLAYSRQWAIRCVHEAMMHQDNSFLTLTYRPEDLPGDLSVHKEHHQLFLKRLRKHVSPKKIKFFHCGEYGEKNLRPHYHTILFGYDFTDKVPIGNSNGNILYQSDMLADLWPYGFNTIGNVSFHSAAYVARYCMKKVNTPPPDHKDYEKYKKHYERVDAETGEMLVVHPEYATMSQGIGLTWLKKYKNDLRKGFITIDRKPYEIPKYYLTKLEDLDYDLYVEIKEKLHNYARDTSEDTLARLTTKAVVKDAQTSILTRKI